MSIIAEYRHLERQLASKLQTLDALKVHPRVKQDLEFERKLRNLITEYNFSAHKILSILSPATVTKPQPTDSSIPKQHRTPRKAKFYRNPHTGEIAITKGGNHKVLKEWKRHYGPMEVESWVSNWI
ncbi:histone-like nucleoid-structuring protein, MvaT/MvaU family [Pseudomonas sp. NPDC090592]|uniref:histone-like nucleoid-structuring protein, MvaT/MvaU family n=1 Tax=Pseudomonas sp. NPDC090592 TaxID=3364480 RepID=UPI00383BBD70